MLLSKASEKMVAQFNPSKPHCSKCGAVPNVPCQVPKPPARIRPNRRIVISSYLGLLQPHKPKPANHLSRIRPNRGLAEYLLGRYAALFYSSDDRSWYLFCGHHHSLDDSWHLARSICRAAWQEDSRIFDVDSRSWVGFGLFESPAALPRTRYQSLVDEMVCFASGCGRSAGCADYHLCLIGDILEMNRPNKSLQATRDGQSSSASRFTAFGPACLSSGR